MIRALLEKNAREALESMENKEKFPAIVPGKHAYMFAPDTQKPQAADIRCSFTVGNVTYVIWHEPRTI